MTIDYSAGCHACFTGRCAKSVAPTPNEALAFVRECEQSVPPDWNGRCAYQGGEVQDHEGRRRLMATKLAESE